MENNLLREEKYQSRCRVIRDARFMTRPVLCEKSIYDMYPALKNDLEQDIALAFDKKDLLQLATLLVNIDKNNLFIKKAKNSPLYVNKKHYSLEKEVGLIETALYLLINDKGVLVAEVARAYNLINNYDLLDKHPLQLKQSFENRMGILESMQKKNMIIEKLRQAQNGLGFIK